MFAPITWLYIYRLLLINEEKILPNWSLPSWALSLVQCSLTFMITSGCRLMDTEPMVPEEAMTLTLPDTLGFLSEVSSSISIAVCSFVFSSGTSTSMSPPGRRSHSFISSLASSKPVKIREDPGQKRKKNGRQCRGNWSTWIPLNHRDVCRAIISAIQCGRPSRRFSHTEKERSRHVEKERSISRDTSTVSRKAQGF